MVGDFTGNGRADIAGRTGSGQWWVARSTGSRLATTYWGRWNPNVDWTVVVGDFNGDGVDDIAGLIASNGDWWVAVSKGDDLHFQNTYFGRWSPAIGSVGFIGSGHVG